VNIDAQRIYDVLASEAIRLKWRLRGTDLGVK
jgi:hypothetical protein